jgi:hypothetical protein
VFNCFKARGTPHAHFLLWTKGEIYNENEFHDYMKYKYSACLPQPSTITDVNRMEIDAAYCPFRDQYHIGNHPCSIPMDRNADYYYEGPAGNNECYGDAKVRDAVREVLKSVNMHRCCFSCYK